RRGGGRGGRRRADRGRGPRGQGAAPVAARDRRRAGRGGLDVRVAARGARGGGGLIAGWALRAKALRPSLRVIGVEPVGAASMYESLRAGRVVELDEVRTIAGTLAPRAIGPLTFACAREVVDEVVLVSDDELRAAQRLLWSEVRQLVEPAGAAAMAALAFGHVKRIVGNHVGVLVCGANLDVDALWAAD